MITKFYIIMLEARGFVYIKDDNGRTLEFDTENEVRDALRDQKTKGHRGTLCWKKEEMDL